MRYTGNTKRKTVNDIQQRKTKAPPQKSESGIPASESNHELEVHDY
jgi:hypothetical protein